MTTLPEPLPTTVDHLVVGAGIVGTATAEGLAAAGHEVLVLERATIASGASGGGGHRGVRANGRDVRELPLAARAFELWPDLDDRLGAATGYRRTGGLVLLERGLRTSGEDERLAARAAVQEGFGLRTERLDAAAVRELVPGVNAEVEGAVHCPADGSADHTATTRAYAAAAARHGAQVREGVSVTGLVRDGSEVVVRTSAGDVRVRHSVLVAANSYTPELLAESFGITLPVWRFVPSYSLLEAPEGFRLDHLVSHSARHFVLKHVEDRTFMASGAVIGRWHADLDRGSHDLATVGRNIAGVVGGFPPLHGARLISSDGTRPESRSLDDVPVIDEVPGDGARIVYATGWSGHGFAIGPAVGEALSTWLATGERPAVLAPFALRRFTSPT